MKSKTIRRLLIGLLFALVIAVCLVWILIQQYGTAKGQYAAVRVSGQTVLTLDLQENTRQWVDGANDIRLCILCGAGGVWVEQSGCPDKICVHKGRISSVGDTIVCLPAQTVVEVIQP